MPGGNKPDKYQDLYDNFLTQIPHKNYKNGNTKNYPSSSCQFPSNSTMQMHQNY